MEILWGEPKRIANIAKHRLDFATLTEEFFANALVLSAKGGRDPSDRNGCKRRYLDRLRRSWPRRTLGDFNAPGFEEGEEAVQCQALKRNPPTRRQT